MFKFDDLNNLRSFAARIQYCDLHLTRMKAGSARRAYDMGNGHVLKLALNAKGIAQNDVESDAGIAVMYPDELNEPLDWSEDSTWLTSAKLEPVKKKDVEEFYGVSWVKLTDFFVKSSRYIIDNINNKYPDLPESEDPVKHERLVDLNRMLMDSNILSSDFVQISAFGHDKKTGLIKLMDFGFNKEVFFNHYQRPVNNYGRGMGY